MEKKLPTALLVFLFCGAYLAWCVQALCGGGGGRRSRNLIQAQQHPHLPPLPTSGLVRTHTQCSHCKGRNILADLDIRPFKFLLKLPNSITHIPYVAFKCTYGKKPVFLFEGTVTHRTALTLAYQDLLPKHCLEVQIAKNGGMNVSKESFCVQNTVKIK